MGIVRRVGRFLFRSVVVTGGLIVAGGSAAAVYNGVLGTSGKGSDLGYIPALEQIPSRERQLNALRTGVDHDGVQSDQLDVLVIGGGATGAGIALDAALRSLRVGLVEREDFASGTSSRSTKLIHGGVRYLEKAFFQMDPNQLFLVFEALSERRIMLNQAPHLTLPLPTILPCYKFWEVPFYWIGLKAYDFVAFAGNGVLHMSKFVSAGEARRLFPTLAESSLGRHLRGSIVYYDGQMNDSRFCVSLALTAALHGALVANHTEALRVLKDDEGRVCGAELRDNLTGKTFPVRARVVINATGPFTDSIRQSDDENARKMIVPSAGVHITLPEYYSAEGMGLIVPKTKDGRVIFMLPWLGSTIAGTTDSSTEITDLPKATEAEVGFILDALSDYLNVDVRRKDVKSAWCGIRPLAINPDANESDTQNILREHSVHVSPSGLVTITGGKWTTYRRMAKDALDKAIEVGDIKNNSPCRTGHVQLIGGHKYDPAYFTFLTQQYEQEKSLAGQTIIGPLDVDCARHLAESYGDQSYKVAEISQNEKLGHRLAHGFPIIEAEVAYCARYEYCETIVDFIGRRSRLVFLDSKAADAAVDRIADILAAELKWDKRRKRKMIEDARTFVASFSSGI
mmetsp:Transcript_15136/g.30738  ORF Transcript_15136/g.30738 Transcript_15136/m.30738 type:complete len:626 (-) Transcript_15136:3382-5259(-)|eukprot:CAMPEP_0184689008 /NCGR_PEP_ID=MMETSP0312-20130426/30396_1 /TAXON_ID=31354 /ORGANISM="Compsopogon coeruleus, Strain SAG 36.94" /LENGTH=625 /DNA_ID=CAMNT_0027146293 /DNA_START=1525 /DNA_END=3402 /DNA_ORIENTATION=-